MPERDNMRGSPETESIADTDRVLVRLPGAARQAGGTQTLIALCARGVGGAGRGADHPLRPRRGDAAGGLAERTALPRRKGAAARLPHLPAPSPHGARAGGHRRGAEVEGWRTCVKAATFHNLRCAREPRGNRAVYL